MNDKPSEVGKRIADELAACGVRLVASLPDNWLTGVIDAVDRDDRFVHHASNSLYLRPVLDAINMPYQIIGEPRDISAISRCYHHTRTFSRPMAVVFTRDLLRGGPA